MWLSWFKIELFSIILFVFVIYLFIFIHASLKSDHYGAHSMEKTKTAWHESHFNDSYTFELHVLLLLCLNYDFYLQIEDELDKWFEWKCGGINWFVHSTKWIDGSKPVRQTDSRSYGRKSIQSRFVWISMNFFVHKKRIFRTENTLASCFFKSTAKKPNSSRH